MDLGKFAPFLPELMAGAFEFVAPAFVLVAGANGFAAISFEVIIALTKIAVIRNDVVAFPFHLATNFPRIGNSARGFFQTLEIQFIAIVRASAPLTASPSQPILAAIEDISMNRIAQVFILTAIASVIARAEPLKTEYPKPLFGCGPGVVLRNMEPPHENREWEYDLPSGCSNIALGRAVSSSDPVPVFGKLSQVTDGNKSTEDETIVELHAGSQWIQIDLGKDAEIYAILVWHCQQCYPPGIFKGVIVQLANDKDFKKDVSTIFNSDCDNLNGQGIGKDFSYVESNFGKLFDAKGKKARYVRLWSHGSTHSDLNCYTEVDVWGR